jgi:hypothetical protein
MQGGALIRTLSKDRIALYIIEEAEKRGILSQEILLSKLLQGIPV